MRTTRAAILLTIVIPLVGATAVEGQAPAAVSIHVKETAGIRRTRYPVNARVPFPRGVLKDAAQTRLTLDNGEVEAQIAAETRHPDGSIQWLAVDFNPSIGPIEAQTYRLEYGDGVKAPAAGRGVAVDESKHDSMGRIRLSRATSRRFIELPQEILAQGVNGFAVTDNGGTTLDLSGGIHHDGDRQAGPALRCRPLFRPPGRRQKQYAVHDHHRNAEQQGMGQVHRPR